MRVHSWFVSHPKTAPRTKSPSKYKSRRAYPGHREESNYSDPYRRIEFGVQDSNHRTTRMVMDRNCRIQRILHRIFGRVIYPQSAIEELVAGHVGADVTAASNGIPVVGRSVKRNNRSGCRGPVLGITCAPCLERRPAPNQRKNREQEKPG